VVSAENEYFVTPVFSSLLLCQNAVLVDWTILKVEEEMKLHKKEEILISLIVMEHLLLDFCRCSYSSFVKKKVITEEALPFRLMS